jgi:hypothetical protein
VCVGALRSYGTCTDRQQIQRCATAARATWEFALGYQWNSVCLRMLRFNLFTPQFLDFPKTSVPALPQGGQTLCTCNNTSEHTRIQAEVTHTHIYTTPSVKIFCKTRKLEFPHAYLHLQDDRFYDTVFWGQELGIVWCCCGSFAHLSDVTSTQAESLGLRTGDLLIELQISRNDDVYRVSALDYETAVR